MTNTNKCAIIIHRLKGVLFYCEAYGDMMNDRFICNGELIDIVGKKYSDMGISIKDLCKLLGIEREIINLYNNWYVLDDKFYYFKNEYVFRELLMSELFNELNVRCVDFKLVKKNGRIGIVSESYRMKGKDYYMYNDFCLRYFNRNASNLIDFREFSDTTFGSKNSYELMDNLYGMLAMDLFSGQVDRGEYNFFFECNEKSVRLAPLCDNGACLLNSKIFEFPFGDFSLSDTDSFCYLLKSDIDFYYKVESVMDIDIYSLLEKVFDKYKVNINEEYRRFILRYFDLRRDKMNKCLKLCKRR